MFSSYTLLPTDSVLWKVSITIHAVTRKFSHVSRVILGILEGYCQQFLLPNTILQVIQMYMKPLLHFSKLQAHGNNSETSEANREIQMLIEPKSWGIPRPELPVTPVRPVLTPAASTPLRWDWGSSLPLFHKKNSS